MKVTQTQTDTTSNRSATQDSWQKQLAQVANNSKEAAAQRAFISGANDSPRIAAQRQRIKGYTDGQHMAAAPTRSTAQTIRQKASKAFEDEEKPLGTDIHVAPGQEKHVPHKAWHVVQQAQELVQPTLQMKDGLPVNDDKRLEHEADVMGEKALRANTAPQPTFDVQANGNGIGKQFPAQKSIPPLQRYADECKGHFQYQFTGTVNADQPKDHNGVPRAYYSNVPTGKNPDGDKVNGENGQPLPLAEGTQVDAGQLHTNTYWRAVCIVPPGRKNHEIVWVLNAYITDPREPAKPAAQKPQAATKPKAPTTNNRLLAKGVDLELDMNGTLTSNELHVSLNSGNGSTVTLNFKHLAGTKTFTATVTPDNIDLTDAYLYSTGSTDGIHPLEIQIAGHSKTEKDKTDVFKLFIVPSATPGKYGITQGKEFNAATITWFDSGVAAGFNDIGPKIIKERQPPQKEGGTYRFDLAIGPETKINAALFAIKDPDQDNSILCYFSADPLSPTGTGIQSEPSKRMSLPIPVTFEELDIEKSAENNGSISYRFLPPEYKKGMLLTYEMKALGTSGIDPNNAMHGLNVYPLDTDAGLPQSTPPAAKDSFKLKNGLWQYGAEYRTPENFRIESAKDAHAKLATTNLPDNEQVLLLNEMGLLVMAAAKENITSAEVYQQWMQLSYSITVHGEAAAKGDETAKQWLNTQANKFIDLLLAEIGGKGNESTTNAAGVGPSGGPMTTSTTNKYTGAASKETQWLGLGPTSTDTVTLSQPFENVRALLKTNNYGDALTALRGSYYSWVQDQLLANNNADKASKDKLLSYGYQLSYRSQLRDTLSAQKKPLQKVKALYYPDLGNITDESGKKHTAGSEIKSIPLDIYYQDTGEEWLVYNFTTLTQPGKLNDFRRSWKKQPGEFAPPQEMFDLLSYDNGIGTGYINYQTLVGEGGIVRIDHPWTLGDALLTASAVLGLIALALTGVGLFLEAGTATAVGAAGAATVLGDIAAIGAAAGATAKLGEDIHQGAPISAARIGELAVDITVALLPAVRSLRGIASLRRYKDAFILLDKIENATLLAKLNAGANVAAIITASANSVAELTTLSKALEEGRIDESTFYWAVLRNVGLGVINVVLLHSSLKTLQGRTIGNTTIEEIVERASQKNLLDPKPTAMYSRQTLQSGIEIMQESASVYRAVVLEALSGEKHFEAAIDVLCYLGKKGRGSIDDVVTIDGKLRRALDVLVEGKFFGKTLAIPQGFTGSQGEALDATPRDFSLFSKEVVDGVHAINGLEHAEVRVQGSATMGITRPKTPGANAENVPAEGFKPWDIDCAIMVEPDDYAKMMASLFQGGAKQNSGKKGVPLQLEGKSPQELLALAQDISTDGASKGGKYNAVARTFANGILTGKANMSSDYFPKLVELNDKIKTMFSLPGLDLSVIAKNSGFDSSPSILLQQPKQ